MIFVRVFVYVVRIYISVGMYESVLVSVLFYAIGNTLVFVHKPLCVCV